MASDKSVNSNHTDLTNVKIKVEPGTSMPVPIRSIKTEPGLSTATTRLTSFRLPRDLTLGGNIKTERPKKVYTPNLNAQRTKKKEDATPADSVKPGRGRDNRGRGRGERGRNDRGRGRASNLIQSSGIWSTGINSTPGKRSSSGGGGGGGYGDSDRSTQNTLERPKLDLNRSVNKAEEEEKLKLLLRDDFIDDGEPVDLDNGPVMLPMVKAKLKNEETKQELEVEEEEINEKPIILENGEVLPPKTEVKVPKSKIELKDEFDSIPEMIENKSNSYILIQFPDCLPGFVGSAEDTRTTRPNVTSQEKRTTSTSETEFCTLNTLKPGILGKLQILKSGKTRLVLGENNLIVDVGSHLSFRQDLIAAKLDTEQLNGDLINLGPVSNTLICSPDWESMLAKL
ncbi:RNA polymerase III subunit C53 isoform X2 [Nomia melanderi]|uniref:RNA polymerase III subunit C53 isoform X2 n=1 Tax=Nomia melanderi TaxID=2448451 RepID=UPI003FCD1110